MADVTGRIGRDTKDGPSVGFEGKSKAGGETTERGYLSHNLGGVKLDITAVDNPYGTSSITGKASAGGFGLKYSHESSRLHEQDVLGIQKTFTIGKTSLPADIEATIQGHLGLEARGTLTITSQGVIQDQSIAITAGAKAEVRTPIGSAKISDEFDLLEFRVRTETDPQGNVKSSAIIRTEIGIPSAPDPSFPHNHGPNQSLTPDTGYRPFNGRIPDQSNTSPPSTLGPLGRPNNNPHDNNGPVTSGGPLGRPNNGGGEGGSQNAGSSNNGGGRTGAGAGIGAASGGDRGDGLRGGERTGGDAGIGAASSGDRGDGLRGGGSNSSSSRSTGGSSSGHSDSDTPGNRDGSVGGFGGGSGWGGGGGWAGVPILLDLDGDGISITELTQSTVFVDTDGDGLQNHTAWAGAGDAVLFYDPDGHNAIVESRQFIFTEWDPTAEGDLEAIRSVFDSNGDGKLTAADAAFADFKLMVTNADGSTSVVTLAAVGIVEIDLNPDASLIVLPDGSRITGQTTYTLGNGTTGTVANAVLMADGNSYNVVQTSTVDGAGTRTTETKGYLEGGTLAFAMTTIATADGSSITNRYDDDGDGVVDRIQTAVTTVDGTGIETETLTNWAGSDVATAVLANRRVTTTSADGNTITIERDSTGGGWFDQIETRITLADGSRTIEIEDLTEDGTVIGRAFETVSADGLTRSQDTDLDGDLDTDVTTVRSIAIDGAGVRTEEVSLYNQDASLRTSTETVTAANGQDRVISLDLDGDGNADTIRTTDLTVNGDGSTTSSDVVTNQDGSLRTASTVTQSDDTLSKTSSMDEDGDGTNDWTRSDVTTIVSSERTEVHTVTNQDGSIRSMDKSVLGADKVSMEVWRDLNQNGIFETMDLVAEVTVDGATGTRTASEWMRNADGSITSSSVTETSEDGLTITTAIDADGDGDTDTEISDVTVINGDGSSTRTVETRNGDGSLRNRSVTDSTADGLSATTSTDIDGDGVADGVSAASLTVNGDGSITRAESEYAGDGTTLLSHAIIDESDDRLTRTVTMDANGDGHTDLVTHSVEAADGSTSITTTAYHADGSVAGIETGSVSANGLVSVTTTDSNADGLNETVVSDTLVYNGDGSTTRALDVDNGDGSDRSETVTTVSDDGLLTTVQSDANGDGTYERVTTSHTVLNADGSKATTTQIKAANGALLSQSVTTISDDGLAITLQRDGDGDGDFDLVETTVTNLLADGSVEVSSELRDEAGNLRESTVNTVSDNGRSDITETDLNGDGNVNLVHSMVIADNGIITLTDSALASDGSLQSRLEETVSDDGLVSIVSVDADGDGTYERIARSVSVLQNDGSVVTTETGEAPDGSIISQTVSTVSDDGLTSSIAEDWNNDGAIDLTTVSVLTIETDGDTVETMTQTAADGSTLTSHVVETSADGRTITETMDLDGNGNADIVSTAAEADDGAVTTSSDYFDDQGNLMSAESRVVSGDGLTSTLSIDLDGDSTVDRVESGITVLGSDGSISHTVEHLAADGSKLAGTQHYESDDGFVLRTDIDLDGDGVFEFQSEEATAFLQDGSIVQTMTTEDNVSVALSSVETTTSGDGLTTTTIAEYDGDGVADRIVNIVDGADGSMSAETTTFSSSGVLIRSTSTTTNADGRYTESVLDRDGDGYDDQVTVRQIDADNNAISTVSDLASNGTIAASVSTETSANGMLVSTGIDVNGDGTTDITRLLKTSFLNDGSMVTELTETGASGGLMYFENSTAAANGLSSVTVYDVDGDGVIDATKTKTTTLNADGSQTRTIEIHYADGELHSSSIKSVSSDGRTIDETIDIDGNGVADKTTHTQVEFNGAQTVTEATYNEGGSVRQQFTTATTADGLITTVDRGDSIHTITRSSVDPRSYTWDNGLAASQEETNVVSEHQVDAFGIDSWTVTRTWQESINGTVSEVTSVRLDAKAASEIYAEAEAVYDAVLDRNLDYSEYETLVLFVSDGRLDVPALVNKLVHSNEFSTRYGDLNDAEFVIQIHLNALDRAPSLSELAEDLDALASPQYSRTELAMDLALSGEHAAVGNSHRITNNFDVTMNTAEFERPLDKAYVHSIIASIVDVVYDRDASEQELDYLSDRILLDPDNPSEIVDFLFDNDDVHQFSANSLKELTGAALVEQAFLNAFGREPTAAETTTWQAHLSEGRITKAQFIASLAVSIEHQDHGNTHTGYATSAINIVGGTSADDALVGTAEKDFLEGLEGADTLDAGSGNDILVGGDGADTFLGGDGNDILILDVADIAQFNATQVAQTAGSIDGGDGYDVALIEGDNDISLVLEQARLETIYSGGGNDTIRAMDELDPDVFLDPATGDRYRVSTETVHVSFSYDPGPKDSVRTKSFNYTSDILVEFQDAFSNLTVSETDAETGETVSRIVDFTLLGGSGNDLIHGSIGADTIAGESGDDTLEGDFGNDVYYYGLSDGNDLIRDVGLSPEYQEVAKTYTYSYQYTLYDNDHGIAFGNGSGSYGYVAIDIVTVDGFGGIDTLQMTGSIRWENLTFASVDVEGAQSLEITVHGEDETGSATAETVTLFGQGNDVTNVEVLAFANGLALDMSRLLDGLGTASAETLTGTEYNDALLGFDGDDTLNGAAGFDFLVGGSGNDTLAGGLGDDGYFYALGDGDDIIQEGGTPPAGDESENPQGTDVLYLGRGIRLDDLGFAFGGTGGNDLVIAVSQTTETVTGQDAEGNDIIEEIVTQVGSITVENFVTAENRIEWIILDDGAQINVPIMVGEALSSDGDDMITWTDTALYVDAGDGNDTITGGEHDDILIGGRGEDTIHGGDGDDQLYGDGGVDALYGDDGNDTIYVDELDSLYEGGAGEDTLIYRGQYDFDYSLGQGAFEHAETGSGNDIITGNAADNTIDLGAGDDEAHGGAGNDTLIGGVGADSLYGDDGDDVIYVDDDDIAFDGGAGNDTVVYNEDRDWVYALSQGNFENATTGSGNDIITGNAADNTIDLGAGNDEAHGGGGIDILRGNEGDDILDGGSGADALDGGEGIDTASYETSASGVTVDLRGASGWGVYGGDAEGDTLTNIENLIGSDHADTFVGDTTNNVIWGGAGNDSLHGWSGNDTIYGGDGNDTLHGNAGNDTLLGDAGNDTLRGFEGADTLIGGAGSDQIYGNSGADILDGGDGADWLRYDDSDAGVTVNLATNTVSGGHADGDVIANFEYVVGSQLYDDHLTGDAGNNYLYGYDGNDTIIGGAGSDNIEGHQGADFLDGGDGGDWLRYYDSNAGVIVNLATNTVSGGHADGDVIANFEHVHGSRDYDDHLTGDAGNNYLYGHGGNDTIEGGAGVDTLNGGDGNDTLDGGAGSDRAIYSGLSSNYAIHQLADGTVQAHQLTGAGYVDTLVSIERLQFDDGLFQLEDIVEHDPIVANGIDDQITVAEQVWSFTVPANTFSDADGDALTLSATLEDGSALPSWLSFDATSGTFSGTPPAAFLGSLSLKVTASDGQYTASEGFELAVNHAPTVVDEDLFYYYDMPSSWEISSWFLANDSDADGDPISVVSVQDAVGGNVDMNTVGYITFTPDAGYTDVASFTYTVSDGTYSSTGTVTMTGSYYVNVGKPILIDLDGDGVEIAPMDESFALFDWDDDGWREETAWAGSDDGLLVYDENGDGEISSAKEIAFAQWAELAGEDGLTDMEALATYFDVNGDGVLNAQDDAFKAGDALVEAGLVEAGDRIWDNLAILQDSDGDGAVDAGELQSLADHDITEVGVTYSSEEQILLSDGSFISGFLDVTQTSEDGETQTLLGADVAFAYSEAQTPQDAGGDKANTFAFEVDSDTFVFNTADTSVPTGHADTIGLLQITDEVHLASVDPDAAELADAYDIEAILDDINAANTDMHHHFDYA